MHAYSAIAELYDAILHDSVCDGKWQEYVYSRVSGESGCSGVRLSGADVACGTGAFTRYFKRKGLDVIGSDISEEMLNVAAARAREEGLSVTFLKQDMRKLKVRGKLDFISAVNDGLNYIHQDELEKTFKHFASCLKVGGRLFFDISSEYKLRNVIGGNMFGEDCDDYSYMWFNRIDGDSVVMDITLFTREGELYRRSDERHIQYIHSQTSVCGALKAAGFDLISVEGHLGGEVCDSSERLNFCAKKRVSGDFR